MRDDASHPEWSIIMADDIDQFRSDLHTIIRAQRAAYEADGFPSAAVRIDRLKRVTSLVLKNKERMIEAISQDFGHRSREDADLEMHSAVSAFRTAAENVETWIKAEKYPALIPDADARVEYTPLGVAGIIGPWNYPLPLILGPLAGILAAGNRAIAKPSEFTPKFSDVLGN
jgi:coniferyl-aldehyde dehydrogenase